MRAVLWDLDGTIADNEELHFAAWQQTLSRYGVDYSYAQFRHDFGRRNAEALADLLPDAAPELIARIGDEKEANFRELLPGAGLKPLPGVMMWLERFQKEGILQAIGSSGPMANIVALVQALGIGDYFMVLLSGARLPRSKPDPMIFLNAAAALGVPPRASLVIEDSVHGIVAARRAGMSSVAVGALASKPLLEEVLAQEPGPPCFAAGSLESLTWEQINLLWEGTV